MKISFTHEMLMSYKVNKNELSKSIIENNKEKIEKYLKQTLDFGYDKEIIKDIKNIPNDLKEELKYNLDQIVNKKRYSKEVNFDKSFDELLKEFVTNTATIDMKTVENLLTDNVLTVEKDGEIELIKLEDIDLETTNKNIDI